MCEKNSSADAKVSGEGGSLGTQVQEQRAPTACGEYHGEAGWPPEAHESRLWR